MKKSILTLGFLAITSAIMAQSQAVQDFADEANAAITIVKTVILGAASVICIVLAIKIWQNSSQGNPQSTGQIIGFVIGLIIVAVSASITF